MTQLFSKHDGTGDALAQTRGILVPGWPGVASTAYSDQVQEVQELQTLESGEEKEPTCIKWTTEIRDLGDAHYELNGPLSILIEEYPDENNIVARQVELEAFGEGEDEFSAIQALRLDIIRIYEELIDVEPSELGPLLQSWQRIIKKLIVRVPHEVE